jgi:hypothetical protein
MENKMNTIRYFFDVDNEWVLKCEYGKRAKWVNDEITARPTDIVTEEYCCTLIKNTHRQYVEIKEAEIKLYIH